MRKFLATLIALCAVTGAHAAYTCVVVHFNDGGKAEITLTEKLKMNFTKTDLVVTGSDTDVTVARTNIKYFEHKDYSGVNGVETRDSHRFTGDAIEFFNLRAGTRVSVFDAAGNAVLSSNESGDCRISLQGLAAGVYVVVAGNNSFKILIK